MKKKLFLLVFLGILLVPIAFGNQFKLKVDTAYTDPYPVEPGQNFILAIDVSNNGTEEIGLGYIELNPNYPFTVLENKRVDIKNLGPWDRRTIEYDMFVDSGAVSTVYEIPVSIVYNNGDTVINKKITVRVQGTPQFEVLAIRSDKISPGDRENLSVHVQNVGTGMAKKMTATLTVSSEYIKPIFSGGSVYLDSFEINEKDWVTFDILVDQDAEYGVYTGTLALTYKDEAGTEHTSNHSIGILVSGEPTFDVVKTEIDQEDKELEVEVINSGTAKALAITGELWLNGDLSDTDYVTQVKIDKKSILKFNLPGKVTTGKLVLKYKGSENELYEQELNVAWEAQRPNTTLILIGVLVIATVVIWKKPWKKLKWFKK